MMTMKSAALLLCLSAAATSGSCRQETRDPGSPPPADVQEELARHVLGSSAGVEFARASSGLEKLRVLSDSALALLPLTEEEGLSLADQALAVLSRTDKEEALRRIGRNASWTLSWVLARLLEDEEGEIRGWAAVEMGRLGHKQHAGRVARLLGDTDFYARGSALWALGRLGAREYWKGHTREIAELLSKADQVGEYRAVVVEALGDLGAREYARDMVRAVRDSFEPAQDAGIGAARKLGADVFAELLKDREAEVRTSAAIVLGRLGEKKYTPQIAEMLGDEYVHARGAALEALGLLDAREHARDIAKLLDDDAILHIGVSVSGQGTRRTWRVRVMDRAAELLSKWGIDPGDLKKK